MNDGTRGALSAQPLDGENSAEAGIRPRRFEEYVGQTKAIDNLRVFIGAAKRRGEVLDHTLFWSPPGLGKTTLAHIIATELGVTLHTTSGPAIDRKGDLAGILSNLQRGDVLFIDEIHRLNPIIEENLYPAMEDFIFDIMIGEGPHAKSIKLPLQPFTLIGATTRAGMLTSPLRDRFGISIELEYYSPEQLTEIVNRSARILQVPIEPDAAWEIARRSRGTPRITNRLLRRVHDFAVVFDKPAIDLAVTRHALEKLEIDSIGLDPTDQRVLRTIIDMFGGGPVGLKTLCASLSMEEDTLEDVYEPYLIKHGFLQRTPKGRIVTHRAYEHLRLKPPATSPDLFSYSARSETETDEGHED